MSSTARGGAFLLAVVLLTAWGAFAFGAEYAWGYVPLLVFAPIVALLGWRAGSGWRAPTSLALALFVTLAAVLLQLMPVPRAALGATSPAAVAADYDQLFARTTMAATGNDAPGQPREGATPVSVAPLRTILGFAFVGVFAVLFGGTANGISAIGASRITRALVVLGVVAAIAGLAQKASGSSVVYGFWYPPKLQYDSAPFVNRNHTAGWLLMALAVSTGYVAALMAKGLRAVKPDWRNRLLWFASREASGTLLAALAVLVMAIAIVITASRSGTLCLAFTIAAFAGLVLRRLPSRTRRAAAVAYLLVVVLAVLSWGRFDVVLQRMERAPDDVRPAIWADTLRIIRDAPWTGTGLNTYGIAMLHYQTVEDGFQYAEAHNDYLQLAAEGGLLLGIPILVTIGLFVREVRRRFREGADDTTTYWIRAGAAVGLCAIALQETVDFTLQMPGAAVLFVVLAAIAIHKPDHLKRRASNARA